ncbi:hypothetical protein B5M42_001695 [Paenibacillus athensensis]|uniref:Uncharacterized protein n=1 Tax=Paenibacillus athensensis TaxID=1967502 RepID=A0A4Y8QAJ0_9BACL|nr:hypothetical protein [Paenibacillus athensensis]MCD1257549.1 hypothetical protein [Paenibacillus athensensis]
MVDTRQHQQPLQHALDAAEHAILLAQEAERKLQAAMTQADPQAIASAQAELGHAKRQVADANSQLDAYNKEPYAQQIKQTLEQLHQAAQDLDVNQAKSTTPKQIR